MTRFIFHPKPMRRRSKAYLAMHSEALQPRKPSDPITDKRDSKREASAKFRQTGDRV